MVDAMERLGGGGFVVGKGENRLGWVHVSYLAAIYVTLMGDVLEEKKKEGGKSGVAGVVGEEEEEEGSERSLLWGPEAYYFAADEEMSWSEWMEVLAPEVRRHLDGDGEKSSGIREVGFEQVVRAIAGDSEPAIIDEAQATLFGTEMRYRSDRAQELLGWVPRGEGGVKVAVGETVDVLFAKKQTAIH